MHNFFNVFSLTYVRIIISLNVMTQSDANPEGCVVLS